MATRQINASKIWDDESGEPCPMTVEEFDARLDASSLRMEKEIEEAEARNKELEELVARKEAILAHLQATFEDARRETDTINARAAALLAASRLAQRKNRSGRLRSVKSQSAA